MYRAEYVKMATEILALREPPSGMKVDELDALTAARAWASKVVLVTKPKPTLAAPATPAPPAVKPNCSSCLNSAGMRDPNKIRDAITALDLGLHWQHTTQGHGYWGDVVDNLNAILRAP